MTEKKKPKKKRKHPRRYDVCQTHACFSQSVREYKSRKILEYDLYTVVFIKVINLGFSL